MAWHRSVGLIVMAGVLFGCATLNREACLNADWYLIGYEDQLIDELDEMIETSEQSGST